jgi:hypothetical protein
MKQILTILCLSLIMAVSVMAQDNQKKPESKAPDAKAPDVMPSVDQILDTYVKAVGGKAAVQKLTTRVLKGSFELPEMGANGSIESYAKAPNKFLRMIDIAGFGTVQEAFNGTAGWVVNPQTGLQDITGSMLAAMKRDALFHKELKLREIYPKMALKGKEKVGNREAYVIEATPAEGSLEKIYFDAQTGLILRRDSERVTAEGMLSSELYFDDFKEVDGVKLPFTIRRSKPSGFIIKVTEIKHNVPIEDAKFNKPAGP